MEDIFVTYRVKLIISGNFNDKDCEDIHKIALKIGSLFNHECIQIEFTPSTDDKMFSYEIKNVWKFPGDEGWLCQMNPKKLFKNFNKDQCKKYLRCIGLEVRDVFIEKILTGEIQIEEFID